MFINPLLLFGLPLAALPILIHLINRQRHRTVPWGAMMFLLDAKRLQRSMAKLRYWLIMAMRVLSIAALFFAASRPLASGWLGNRLGNASDTVLFLLDRSPSMEETDPATQRSKRVDAIEKFAELMKTTGEGKRMVLIESTRELPEEVDVDQLAELPATQSSDAMANVPRMLEAAAKYLSTNEVAQADIWIASDMRVGDWAEDDGRWAATREQLSNMPGVRLSLLSYLNVDSSNRSVRILSARRIEKEEGAEVRIQFAVDGVSNTPLAIEFELNGVTSALEIDASSSGGDEFEHSIAIQKEQLQGWGRISLPADRNPADNVAYYVFGPEPVRRTTIVTDSPTIARPLQLMAAAGTTPDLSFEVAVLPTTKVAQVDWDNTSFLVWHAPLPTGTLAKQLMAFLQQGRPVLCFPPIENADPNAEFGGVTWGEWNAVEQSDPVGIGYWDNESGLLSRTESGNALPVGKQVTRKYCQLTQSDSTLSKARRLAKYTNDDDLLVKPAPSLPLYFCTTLPSTEYSTLAQDGVTLYALMHRAVQLGADSQAETQMTYTATKQAESSDGKPGLASLSAQTALSGIPDHAVSAGVASFAGCHQSSERLTALNRPEAEDLTQTVTDEAVERLFAGLEFQSITDASGSNSSLVNEIWRLFLAAMAVALVCEAYLCLG